MRCFQTADNPSSHWFNVKNKEIQTNGTAHVYHFLMAPHCAHICVTTCGEFARKSQHRGKR
jgi:hypothetical protein